MLALGILDIGMRIYHGLLTAAGVFHPKAKAITSGQRNAIPQVIHWRQKHPNQKVLWMHVASLGEFEQGRPVMELFKVQHPEAKVVLTFYSPSGYEVRKNYAGADLITYLPLDTKSNMDSWCEALRPNMLALVKYEVWPNMLQALGKRDIPVVMLSAVFYEQQRFFGWQKNFWISILKNVSFFHVQDDRSKELLDSISLRNIEVSGDTRYDRVFEIAQKAQLSARYKEWKGESLVVVLGSSYKEEEEAIKDLIQEFPEVKWVIAPHHIEEDNIQRIETTFQGLTQRATQVEITQRLPILILNTMGELGGLYKMGEIAVIGGGWGKGIHNVLEPASHGCAVVWGPRAEKFIEAKLMLAHDAGIQVLTKGELENQLRGLINDSERRDAIGNNARELVQSQSGASAKVLKTIGEFWR